MDNLKLCIIIVYGACLIMTYSMLWASALYDVAETKNYTTAKWWLALQALIALGMIIYIFSR